jgi:hypothetical protein
MKKSNSWLYISILLFVIAVIWAGVSAYSQMRKPTIPPDLQKIMEPLDPNLDMTTLQKIKERSQ